MADFAKRIGAAAERIVDFGDAMFARLERWFGLPAPTSSRQRKEMSHREAIKDDWRHFGIVMTWMVFFFIAYAVLWVPLLLLDLLVPGIHAIFGGLPDWVGLFVSIPFLIISGRTARRMNDRLWKRKRSSAQ